ncbi:MAG: transcriptional repressor LexA [Dongiaceae bacterium]
MLTAKQLKLLQFIETTYKTKHICPSFEEMKRAIGLESKSGVHRLITALEERGFIRRLPNRARAIEVVRSATGMVKGSIKKASETLGQAVRVPLLGRIAAGTPIEAIRETGNDIDVPIQLVGRGEHYALEVDGDSMIEAGIFDGDTVLIRRTDYADNGAIVVALVDSEEVTLKTLRRRAGKIELEPSNKRYKVQSFKPERVQVQGVMVGLVRKYAA